MDRMNLGQAARQVEEMQNRRRKINYTGREDLDLIRKIDGIRKKATEELKMVRAQIEVCPMSMIHELKGREEELLEFLGATR